MMKESLKELFEKNEYILAPEIYDCISAKCVEACGFKATILSSSEFANSYGYPDLGLLTLDDFVNVTRRICKYSPLPMVVDAEEGFGRVIHAYLTANRLAEAGAAGVLITDLVESGIKGQLPINEAIARIRAAKEGLKGTNCILIARTEMSLDGNLDEPCDRCNRYLDAGADMTLLHFGINPVKGDKTEVCSRIAKRVPGWKWFPDLNSNDHVDLKEVAKMGFNFVGVHYLRTSAEEGMYDCGLQVFKRQDNKYRNQFVQKPENAPGPYTLGLVDWYHKEQEILDDINLKTVGNYKMFERHLK